MEALEMPGMKIPALPSRRTKHSSSSPLTTKSEDDDCCFLGSTGTTTAAENDDIDATISTLAMKDSARSCFSWRRRRQPWKRWRRRPAAKELPLVALCSPSSESLSPQELNDNKEINNGSSMKTKFVGKSPTYAMVINTNVSSDDKGYQPRIKEGNYSAEEVEVVHDIHDDNDDDNDDDCGWHEWTIPLMPPSRTNNHVVQSPNTVNEEAHVGGQDFRVPLLVANEGDLVVRDFFNEDDDDDCDFESIHLLHDSRCGSSSCSPFKNKIKNHLSNIVLTASGVNKTINRGNNTSRYRNQEDDKIALLSEHDRLGDERHGSYDVDRVDENSVAGGSSALQELPLFTLGQNVAQEEADRREREQGRRNNNEYPSQKRPLFIVLPDDNDDQGHNDQPTIHVLGPRGHHEEDDPGSAPAQPGYGHDDDGEVTPSWSAELQSRLEKQKAYQLWKYGPQRPTNTLEATHGELWTLPEMPSEDERTSSSFTTITTKSTVSRHTCAKQPYQQQEQQQQRSGDHNLTSLLPQPQPTNRDSAFFNALPKQQQHHQKNYTRSHNICSLTRQAESQSLLGGKPSSSSQPQDEDCLLGKHSTVPQHQPLSQFQLRKRDIV